VPVAAAVRIAAQYTFGDYAGFAPSIDGTAGIDGGSGVAIGGDRPWDIRVNDDRIYRRAERKLDPQPMPAGPEMTSVGYFREHNRTIERQLEGLPPGALVAGDKKDLVLTRWLAERPGRVAIYGWHRGDGEGACGHRAHGDRPRHCCCCEGGAGSCHWQAWAGDEGKRTLLG